MKMLDILKEDEALENKKLEVRFSRKSIVKAANLLPEQNSITLSNLDLLSGRFPVSYFYFYLKPSKPVDHDFTAIVETLKSSLSQTLSHYYPFAGRIVQNPRTNEPEILCDNNGALVVEAQANIPLKKLDFHNLNKCLQGKLVSIQPDFPLQIQVTNYTCGGISITFTFDHALGDASAFGNFMVSWSEIAQKKPLSTTPNHHRNLLCARFPPKYHQSLDQTFVKCTMEDILNMPMKHISLKRLYHVNASSIDMLQTLASADGTKRTKIEAFSAYVWKVMVNTIDASYANCKMGWLVDGRGRMVTKGSDSMSNYIGNVLSLASGEARIQELKEASISDIAKIVP
ncbi:HXXXD-type acyl-transferase family protein [Quillaja saponaria]|uniref:HXXXD-type acyl-transferase family protein n=1 Tax=Quillaja saponaria TaxID=32244 RepID=A0AAD7L814_QUISA|nr:HXXXD-type acyl-transferase family protein [Quillaja saponaria]